MDSLTEPSGLVCWSRAPAGPLFAAPVIVARPAGPSDRLAAFLGRSPRA
jgi:hypothetical protein